ncbi:type II toxin-antitoxin system HigB family toxin [Asinibacterium sp. OR53]|uniref:type II toxin-antitoxin system HigB family toxin n=1 Tax=Asinibacterium sp. OR53 TaxID=925409 RepID=UPI00047B7BC5|nr:type II toxin-antitoxin system HigB family toxin [Asinibacterium sp. OR53]
MRIIAKKTLRDFWEEHPGSKQQLLSWFQEAAKAKWTSTRPIKAAYPSASFLAENRIVFNIKGNTYRLVVKINYDYQMIWIRFVGTHAEYDKINAKTI